MKKAIGRAFVAAAAGAVRLAAKVAPKREIDVFPHRCAQRRPWRLDAWMMQPGWLWIEVGQWSLEVAWKTGKELAAAR